MDTTIALPKEVHKRLKLAAVIKGMTLREATIIAIQEWLKKKGEK